MRSCSPPARALGAALLALLLGLRLLAPAGFMPEFDRGAVTIVACPDAFAAIVPAHHNHGADHRSLHQPCPYAAAPALGALPGDSVLFTALAVSFAVLLHGRPVVSAERRRANERPHPTGPPIPA